MDEGREGGMEVRSAAKGGRERGREERMKMER